MKKNNKKSEEPFGRKEQYVVLFENLSKQFTGLAEGINMNVDGFRNELKLDIRQVDQKIGNLETSVKLINKDLNQKIDETKNELLTKINASRQELKEVKTELKIIGATVNTTRYGIEEKVDAMRQETSDNQEVILKKLENHEERLVKLEK